MVSRPELLSTRLMLSLLAVSMLEKIPFAWGGSSIKCAGFNYQGASIRRRSKYFSTKLLATDRSNLISSKASKTVKKIQGLLTKRKKRAEFAQTVVEGPRMIFDMLENSNTKPLVKQVLVSADPSSDEYREKLSDILKDGDSFVQLVEPSVFHECLTDTVTSQGIIAVVDIPESNVVSINKSQHNPLHLVLDGVSDPGNMGTILRSSLAAGVESIILLPGCCDIWSPKTVRSSMGASFQLPIDEISSWDEAYTYLSQDLSLQTIYAATMLEENSSIGQEGSQPYYEVEWSQEPLALIIGSEGNGLSVSVRDALYRRQVHGAQVRAVHIPMASGIESLNAAVCCSIIAFESARQRITAKE